MQAYESLCSFLCVQPARTCIHYPVENYLLVLKSLSGKIISDTLGYNETETLLYGLEDNQMYTYSVTAINTIGNATTDLEKVLSELNYNEWYHSYLYS